MYMKCYCFDNAFSIFSNLIEPNSISYNAMITGFVQNSQVEKGLELFKLMRQQGLQTDRFSYVAMNPNDFTLTNALAACSELASFCYGAHIHARLIKIRISFNAGVGNPIVNMHAKCGSIRYANSLFQSLPNMNLIS